MDGRRAADHVFGRRADASGERHAYKDPEGRDMLWQGYFWKKAKALGLLEVHELKTIYRTDKPQLLQLAAALRSEDHAVAWPLVQAASLVQSDASFADITHDNDEIYPIADDKFSGMPGVVTVYARSDCGWPRNVQPPAWEADERRALRQQSKMLVKVRGGGGGGAFVACCAHMAD